MNHKFLLVVVIGLVIVSIFAIGTAMQYFRDQEIKSVTESAAMLKALNQSDEAMESFNKTKTETDELICSQLIREYLKDPNSITRELLKSESCKNLLPD